MQPVTRQPGVARSIRFRVRSRESRFLSGSLRIRAWIHSRWMSSDHLTLKIPVVASYKSTSRIGAGVKNIGIGKRREMAQGLP